MLFAEDMPSGQGSHTGFDVTEKLAELTFPAGPTGKKDKVLILSSRQDVHADRVALELVRHGTPVCRFHTEELLDSCRLSVRLGERAGVPLATLQLPSGDLMLEEVKSVWLRRPELPTYAGGSSNPSPATAEFVARETEAALFGMVGLLDDAFWVSHPTQLKASDNKLANLKLARSAGLRIPCTLVTNDAAQARSFYESCHGQVIVKPFCGSPPSADGEGFALFASPVLPEHLDQLHLV
ncbi:MAG: MvdC/MvdD family ATP grasp protein, partial [Egibacteraceae bacterium]